MNAEPPAAARPRRRLLVALAALAGLCVCSIVCANVAIYSFKVPSPSMDPSLRLGELIGAWRWDSAAPEHGAIVVFPFPADPSKDFVKRVVGMPGDRVRVRPDGSVEVNGVPLERCELGPWPGGDGDGSSAAAQPQRRAFIEWDAQRRTRYLTTYSRDPSEQESPSAEFCVREACTVPAGHVFTLGDNRDNSYDSRFWGFVPIASVRARIRSVFRSPGDSSRNGLDVESSPAVPVELHAAFGRCSNR